MRSLPKTMGPLKSEIVQIGAYFLFSTLGNKVIKSFASHVFEDTNIELVYHSTETDNPVWLNCIQIS